MRLRRLSTLLLVLALAMGACTDSGEIGGPTIGGTLAARVGDSFELTNDELEAEVDLWASSPAFLAEATGGQIAEFGTPGRRPMTLVGFALEFRVQVELARQGLTADDFPEPTPDDIDEVIGSLSSQFASFTGFPETFQVTIGEALYYQIELATRLQSGAAVDLPDAVVSSRYGTIADPGTGLPALSPPLGPLAAPIPAPVLGS